MARVWYISGPLTKIHRKTPYGALPELIMEFKPKFAKIGGHFEGAPTKFPRQKFPVFGHQQPEVHFCYCAKFKENIGPKFSEFTL